MFGKIEIREGSLLRRLCMVGTAAAVAMSVLIFNANKAYADEEDGAVEAEAAEESGSSEQPAYTDSVVSSAMAAAKAMIEKQEGQKTAAAGTENADEVLDAAVSDEGVQAELEARAEADEQKQAELEARAEADEQKKAELEARAEADEQKKAEIEAEIKRREEAEAKKRAEIEAKAESEAKARAEAETQLKNKNASAVAASSHETPAAAASSHVASAATVAAADTAAKTAAPATAAHATAGLSPADFMAICKVVEAEAGHQPVHGRSMVANVILNRVKSPAFPNSVSGVLTAPGQFTVVRTNRYANAVPSASTQEAVRKAVAQDMSGGALYFHRGSGSWGNRSYIGTVGSHGFYR